MAKVLIVIALWDLTTFSLGAVLHPPSYKKSYTHASYENECGMPGSLRIAPHAITLLQTPGSDGVGMKLETIKPFETVLKDGFSNVECIKDSMYYVGDKHGANKHDYNQGAISGVSIIHYDAFVDKVDRKPMTHEVCFEFCRTVPDMGFFGVMNGRHCYCSPYYKAMASDSSMCDTVCDGAPNVMCGGKEKSTVFAMHLCGDTEAKFASAVDKAKNTSKSLKSKCGKALDFKEKIQNAAEAVEPVFSKVGDTAATTLAQSAKSFAATVQREHDKACAIDKGTLDKLNAQIKICDSGGSKITYLEKLMQEVDEKMVLAQASEALLDKVMAKEESVKNSTADYYPVAYFVDKALETVPSTCSGDSVGTAIIADNGSDSCASACNAQIHSCIGFQYFKDLCFLFSKFKTISYYTGCEVVPSFLQQKHLSAVPSVKATCYGKFTKFSGTSLAPIATDKKRCF